MLLPTTREDKRKDMSKKPLELEGTWEEIVTHAAELAGCRVRLIVLPPEPGPSPETARNSSASSLLKYAGTWAGNDLVDRLREVYEARGRTEF